MGSLVNLDWETFHAFSASEKAIYFGDGQREKHVILAQQFGRARLDALGVLATRIRRIAKTHAGSDFLQSTLSHKRAMLFFTQPSTRTFLSFCAACEILGLKMGEVRNPSTSSEFKGETRDDSVRTFSSYFDLIIMRSEIGGLAERVAWLLSQSERPVPVINAGSGKDQHPTQALLDIYTLQRSFEERGGIDGKRIVFAGDLKRGRTVRSLSVLLTQYRDVEQCFVAPDALQIGADIQALLRARGVRFQLCDDLKAQLPGADAVYMTRVQNEWDAADGACTVYDAARYRIGLAELDMMKRDAAILHPLPRRDEIATEVDGDSRAVYWRQMRNGMWIRAALIASLFGIDEQIQTYAGV
ncbi:MAG: aspartate/ornithine carbamoyltransferase family protein [Kiritimatiellia bacterium]